jgi:hypothetical protein
MVDSAVRSAASGALSKGIAHAGSASAARQLDGRLARGIELWCMKAGEGAS